MYSSSTSTAHHFFFPPRLQLVALQQNSDGLSSRTGDQFAFDRLLGDQPHRPTRSPLWRLTTDHGDNALLLGIIKNLFGARTRFVVQGGLQAVAVVAVSDFTNCLPREPKHFPDMRGRKTLTKLT